MLLPAPIPNLPPVQPETFSSYEYDIPEYGESSDDENNIDDVPLIVPGDSILDDDTNTDFVINRTFTVASNENETEVHEREKEDIPEVIVPIVVSDLIARVGEADFFNRNLTRGNKSSMKRKSTLKGTHPLLPVRCCKKKCSAQISEERRMDIHKKYWEMDYDSQRLWLSGKVTLHETKRRRKSTPKNNIQRSCSRSYALPENNINNIPVCKEYFLSTLGYKSDKVAVLLV